MLYLAFKMTGVDRKQLNKRARQVSSVFEREGFKVFNPILEEKILNRKGKLTNSSKILPPKWQMDKEAIKKSFCLVLCDADEKSFGAEREYMLMRGVYWSPVVLVSPKHANGYFSVASLEDDAIVGTVEEAALLIKERWGTWPKRLKWRLSLYSRCLVPWIVLHVKRLFQ